MLPSFRTLRSADRAESRALRGFTLVELAVSLLIVAILAGVGMPIFRAQILRARRTEAVLGLEGIYRAQVAYRASTQSYGDTFDEIAFELDGGKRVDERTIQGPIYTFTVRAIPFDGDPRGNFQALATGDLDPSDPILDILMIENFSTVQP